MSNQKLIPKKQRQIRKLPIGIKNSILNDKFNTSDFSDIELYLNSELSNSQLLVASEDELSHQLLLARIFTYKGATTTPLKICTRILKRLSKDNKFDTNFIIKIYYQIATIYTELYYSRGIEQLYTEFKRLDNVDQNFTLYFELIYLQFLVYSAKSDFDLEMQNKFTLLKQQSTTNLIVSEYIDFLELQNLFITRKLPLTDLLKKIELNLEKIQEGSKSINYQLKAKIHALLGQTEEALNYFNLNTCKTFYFKIETLFFKKFVLRQTLSLADELSLTCFPAFNEYSFAIGNRFFPSTYQLPSTFYNGLLNVTGFNTSEQQHFWLIENNILNSSPYNITFEKSHFIDLCTGYFQQNEKKMFLGQSKTMALMIIISTGSFGASDFLIAEKIYSKENISIATAVSRVQDLVTELKQLGLPIYRDNKNIFYDFNLNHFNIQLPKDHIYRGELFYLNTKSKYLNNSVICQNLLVSKRSASLYLKNWKDQQLIVPDPENYGVYFIRTEELTLKTNKPYQLQN